MELKHYIEQSHKTAREKGFWDKDRNIGELLMLITSELGEALEAHRKGRRANPVVSLDAIGGWVNDDDFKQSYELHLKGSFEEELADVAIRLFDLVGGLEIDLEKHIELKMRFNGMRERLHGKAY